MPIYQVTLTYLITVEAENAEDAAQKAYEEVGENPGLYNDIETEKVDTWVDTYDPSADIAHILEMLDEYDKEGWEKLTKRALSILSEMEKEN